MRLHSFHGGLRLAGHKVESTAGGLRDCPLPPRLQVSLLQHAGVPARACVVPGDVVVAGQRIGIAGDEPGADVHSPCAGRVLAVSDEPATPFPELRVAHVLIETAASDAKQVYAALPWQETSPEELRGRIRDAGVVGLGGAGFASADKDAVENGLLILNGVECEPWIACDDALLREHADEVVLGGRLLARVAGADAVVLAIGDSMVEALAAARQAVAAHGDGAVTVVAVPTHYPGGGEAQLIQVLTGREVPRGGLPRDLGVLVHNVGTARAAWRAVTLGEALTDRIVTITGLGVARPGNFRVPLGTPIAHLVEMAGGYTPDAARLLLGGPMMGQALPNDGFPLGKIHNCVLVLSQGEIRDPQPEMPCIRCGDCATVCPAQLLPQQLLWQTRAGRLDRAQENGLFDCIECGCCDLACPSHIPLALPFRVAKEEIRRHAVETQRALAARDRHEARRERLERDANEQAERHDAGKLGAASADAVAAALERARARRAAAQDPKAGP